MIPTGVGLIIISRDSHRILVMRELKAKELVKKEVGMISFPLETVEEGETHLGTARRLIQEEIGVDIDDEPKIFCDPVVIVPGTQTLGAFVVVDSEFRAEPNDSDVAFHGWAHIEDLMQEKAFVRRETVPILEKFLESQVYAI